MRLLVLLLSLTAGIAVNPAAHAQPTSDPRAIWTVQGENASITSANLTDRYYTNGLRLGWTSPTGALPDALAQFGQRLLGDGQQRMTLGLTQQIYTPLATQLAIPPPTDRPYAGVLMGSIGLVHDSAGARTELGLALGLIGPAALGRQVQNGFHSIISQNGNRGWGRQIANEPLVQATASRTWRQNLGNADGLEIDALPNLAIGVGNLRLYGQAGMTFRIGQGLGNDFGVARILPGLSGGDAHLPADFAWYVFVGGDGQAVARDITLDGNDFTSGPSVRRSLFVGELQGGLAVIGWGLRLSYTHVLQTQTFKGQRGGLHQLGALAVSARF